MKDGNVRIGDQADEQQQMTTDAKMETLLAAITKSNENVENRLSILLNGLSTGSEEDPLILQIQNYIKKQKMDTPIETMISEMKVPKSNEPRVKSVLRNIKMKWYKSEESRMEQLMDELLNISKYRQLNSAKSKSKNSVVQSLLKMAESLKRVQTEVESKQKAASRNYEKIIRGLKSLLNDDEEEADDDDDDNKEKDRNVGSRKKDKKKNDDEDDADEDDGSVERVDTDDNDDNIDDIIDIDSDETPDSNEIDPTYAYGASMQLMNNATRIFEAPTDNYEWHKNLELYRIESQNVETTNQKKYKYVSDFKLATTLTHVYSTKTLKEPTIKSIFHILRRTLMRFMSVMHVNCREFKKSLCRAQHSIYLKRAKDMGTDKCGKFTWASMNIDLCINCNCTQSMRKILSHLYVRYLDYNLFTHNRNTPKWWSGGLGLYLSGACLGYKPAPAQLRSHLEGAATSTIGACLHGFLDSSADLREHHYAIARQIRDTSDAPDNNTVTSIVNFSKKYNKDYCHEYKKYMDY